MTIYTLDELAELLKVTKRTLYNYVRSGKLEAVKVGREWRVTEDQLKHFLEEQSTSSNNH